MELPQSAAPSATRDPEVYDRPKASQLAKIPQAPPVPHTDSPLSRVTLGPGLRTFECKL